MRRWRVASRWCATSRPSCTRATLEPRSMRRSTPAAGAVCATGSPCVVVTEVADHGAESDRNKGRPAHKARLVALRLMSPGYGCAAMPEAPTPPSRASSGAQPTVQPRGIDERPLRFERGVAAVLLFGGYVWRRDLVIPLVAIGITVALVPGLAVRPFGVPFERLLAPRLRAARHFVPLKLARTDDLTLATVLAAATLMLL